MKLNILLLFIVGFIALAGAVPVERPEEEEDVELQPAVTDLGKEAAEDEELQPAVADPGKEAAEDEPALEDPETETAESEQDPAQIDADKRKYRHRCRLLRRKLVCHFRKVSCRLRHNHRWRNKCYKKHCVSRRFLVRICHRCHRVCRRCRVHRRRCHWLWRKVCHGGGHQRGCYSAFIFVCPLYRCKCYRVCYWKRHYG